MKSIIAVLRYTKNLWPFMVVIGIGSAMMGVLSLGTPFVVKFATDSIVEIISEASTFEATQVLMYASILLVVTLASALLDDIVGYYGDILAIRLRQQLSNQYYQHLLKLSQTYFDEELAGTIINRLNRAIANITQFINGFSNNLLQMFMTLIISIGVMFYYSQPLGILILILFPSYVWLTGLTSKKWQRYETEINEHYDIASGRFNEVISQMRLVKSFGSEEREYGSFFDHFGKMVSITKRQSSYWHRMNAGRSAVLALIFFGVYFILFYDTARGAMSIGDMVLLLMLVQQVQRPLGGMSFFVDMYQRAAANSRDYVEAMNIRPERINDGSKKLATRRAKIEFDDVSFGYEENNYVLKGISFTINPGKKLALVGESGSGKSTIANLLMRLYSVDKGNIRINGVPIYEYTIESLRRHVSTVFQDSGLFSGTIRENIAYGRPEATIEEVQKAAKIANANDFIQQYPAGYDTEIGERGIKLSGGQKQRIAIARAILKDAPILILDEATSSLDNRSERLVQIALDRLMKSRTVLIVAHRLSTIAGVDTIVTMKNGIAEEVGTPEALAGSGGIYAELLKLQSSATESSREQLRRYDMSD